jgi:DNA-binding transcriptional regulator YiaG
MTLKLPHWSDRVKRLVAAYNGKEALAVEMGASSLAVRNWLLGQTPGGMAKKIIELLEAAKKLSNQPLAANHRLLTENRLKMKGWSGRVKKLVDYCGSPEALAVMFRVTASAVRNWLGGVVPSGPIQVLIELLEARNH